MTNNDIRLRCAARTRSGQKCKIYARTGRQYCHVHDRSAQAAQSRTTQSEPASSEEMRRLVDELDALLADLKKSLPTGGDSPYSPLRLLAYMRQNLNKLSPEVRLGLLENFKGMTREDLMDIDTWKGIAYMMRYSARFQADQVRERMNEHLPEPLQPDRWLRFMKKRLDRVTPEIAKNLMQSFQGASKEDLMDPDTWKGAWYMLDYSLRFQAEQFKQKLTGEEGDEG